MAKLLIPRAMLVYQAGIANVFKVDIHTVVPGARNAKRLRQGAFRSCEDFASGLEAAGTEVVTVHCNEAGDIMHRPWSWELSEAPFSEEFCPVGGRRV